MTDTPTSNHGGKREGAGRPHVNRDKPLANRTKKVTITATNGLCDEIKAVSNNVSAFFVEAVKEKLERDRDL